ncbi:hypothetical protein HYW43_00755 [Candidatus Daviesbacteria bacterium]|nr:hypothetical protein [Candidatus Daviesbacteria bacterium]
MTNIDWQKLGAGYLINEAFLQIKQFFINLSFQDSFFLSPLFLISLISLTALLVLLRRIYVFRKSFKEQSILLELTPPSFTEKESYTTDQLFSIIHSLGNQRSIKDKLLGIKIRFSLEIVSSKNEGIRYLIRTSPRRVNTLRKSLLAYLPHLRVKTVNEYLSENPDSFKKYFYKIIQFKLSKHFAFSLKRQSELDKHDPIAYITGQMTKLDPGELISLQLVLSPAKAKDTKKISKLISSNGDVIKYLKTPWFLKWILYNSYRVPSTKSPSELEIAKSIDSKINQPLFETSIRLLMVFRDKNDLLEREQGFKSSFSTFASTGYQALKSYRFLNINKIKRLLFFLFNKRLLSQTSILSISEISGIYHFPFTSMTNTENLVKSHSKNLPAPLSLKKGNKYHVVFGKNNYGETKTEIGLTEEERETHMYIIGRTGSGKTTMMFSMAKNDIEKGQGMAFLLPLSRLSKTERIASIW